VATTAPVEVVIADNGSVDGTPERAAASWGACLLRTGGNVGYGAAANAGARAAAAEWLVIANPDVVWEPAALDVLLAAGERWTRAAAFGPAIRTPSGALYPSARGFPSLVRGTGHALLGWAWPSNPWTSSYRGEREKPTEGETGWLSGSCLLVRRSAFEAVAGFDSTYFMYCEDMDLCRRLADVGWSSVYVPAAVVTHVGGHATRHRSVRMLAEHHRSLYRYLARQYAGVWLAPLRAGLAAGLAVRFAASLVLRRVAEGAKPTRSAEVLEGWVLEAILLVGGEGTRLRPLTLTTPKPMLPVAGVPFLTHQLARAREAGVEHVVLATSYKSEVFEEHFRDGSDLGLDLEYVTETVPLGTGGGIRNVADRLRGDGPVLIFNGDILSGVDLRALLARHLESNAAVTLHLTEVEDPRAFGVVPTDDAGRVLAFLEKTPDPPTNRINAGCYVFSREALLNIPTGRPVSVERETFPGLLESGAVVMSYVDSTYWLDLGTPEAFVRGSCDLVRGIAPSPAVPGPRGESLVLPGAEIAPDAVVTGGTTIGAEAVVGAGAAVDGSVVLERAIIEPGATVQGSAIGREALVGEGAVLTGVTMGDRSHVGRGNRLPQGSRVWLGAELPADALR
jgi:mannose-1-phosphate guanylyltransferase